MRKHDHWRLMQAKLTRSQDAAVSSDQDAIITDKNWVYEPKLGD
jgi:hypothetical protein